MNFRKSIHGISGGAKAKHPERWPLLFALSVFFLLACFQTAGRCATEIIVDETDPGFSKTGPWTLISNHPEAYPFDGSGDFWQSQVGAITATWTPTLAPGTYEVWANWRTWSTYSKNVEYRIVHAGGTTSKFVNQHQDVPYTKFGNGDKTKDNYLGTFCFDGTASNYVQLVYTSTSSSNDLVAADAIKFVLVDSAASAIPIDDVPLGSQIQTAPPNLMFVLDDSGSMDWEFMTSESNGLFSNKRYVFDNPGDNAYSNSYILSDRGRWKSQWSGYNKMYYDPTVEYAPWPTLSAADMNTPRSHPMEATPTFNLDGTYHQVTNEIVLDNKDSSVYSTNGFNHESGASKEYLGSSYYATVAGEWATWTTPGTLTGNHEVFVWWTIAGTRDSAAQYTVRDDGVLENTIVKDQGVSAEAGTWTSLGTYTFDGTGPGSVTVTRSGNGSSTSADAVKFVPAAVTSVTIINAHYYTWDDVDGNGVFDTGENIYLVNINNPVEYYRVDNSDGDDLVESGELIGVAAAAVPKTVRTSTDPEAADAYTVERQNFANWYSFYRRRELTATAAVSNVINNISGMMVGIRSINSKIIQPVLPVKAGATDQTSTLLNKLYSYHVSAQGTPLRYGLQSVGQYFNKDDGLSGGIGTSPIVSSADGGECQQNFAIVMTDGYYNGSCCSGIGNEDGDNGSPFADGYYDTLADVAMYYYENDLAVNLADQVQVISNYDNATHQHMVTYGVSFGVFGTMNPDEYPAEDDFKNALGNYPAWLDPFSGSEQRKIDDLWHASVNGRGIFLSAGNPQELVNSLLTVILNIESRVGSDSALTLNREGLSGELRTDTRLYETTYNPDGWTGDVKSYALDYATGDVLHIPEWSAKEKLEAFLNDSINGGHANRVIATYDGSVGIPFRYASLTAAQQSLLNNDSALVDYLRGDDTNEEVNGGTFRNRPVRLGDIINSRAVFNNGVLYVGGNDGMLHAFDSSTGDELFAYVPNLVFDHLKELASPSYSHKFYVNLSPYAKTVDDKTYLIGGLGKGGKGYFCLDISPSKIAEFTSPLATPASKENALVSMVMWEYSAGTCPNFDVDMGYSFSEAYMLKTNDTSINSGDTVAGYGVFFGNGYNSAGGSAVLYCLNPKTGAVIKEIDTQFGPGNGLSTPLVIDVDNDLRADYVYAGDLKGNLWKFDLTSPDAANWKVAYHNGILPQPLFRTKDPGQPITSKPAAKFAPDSKHGYLVVFGTGKYLAMSDLTDTSQQTVYGIWDYGDDADDSEYLGKFDPASATPLSNQPSGVTLAQQIDIYEGENVVASFTAVPGNVPNSAEVQFADASSGTITSYNWDFGDGTTSTLQNPLSHTYTSEGVYDISLKVTRDLPLPVVASQKQGKVTVTYDWQDKVATELDDNPVLIDQVVLAYFEGKAIGWSNGVTVQFTNMSQGDLAGAAYLWDFGDGTTSTLKDPPAHTYSAEGEFTVSLTINPGSTPTHTKTNTKYITVSHPWVVNVELDPGDEKWRDIRVLSDNQVNLCTVADATTVQNPNPGACQDDPGTTTVDESTYTAHAGWYFDLPTPRERVIANPDIRNKRAWVITNVPQETMCSSEGYSWIHALDVDSGGRTADATFDMNGDYRLNSDDFVEIGGQWYSVTAVKWYKRIYEPAILDNKETGLARMYFSVEGGDGGGGGGPPGIKNDTVGMTYWREMEQ